MGNKKSSINLPSSANYPVPDIPVEEGWAGMNQLLNANMPPAGNKNGASNKGRKRYLLLLLLLFVSSVAYFGLNNTSKQKLVTENKTATDNTPSAIKEADNKVQAKEINNTIDNKNNSSVSQANITDDKGAVANTKGKQQIPAASNTAANLEKKNTGSGKQSNSDTADKTATLAGSKIQVSVKGTVGTGNSQKGTSAANEDLIKQTAKVAVPFKEQPVINVAEKKETKSLAINSDNNLNDATKTTAIVTNDNTTINKITSVDNAESKSDLNKSSTETTITPQQETGAVKVDASQQALQSKVEVKKISKAIKQLGINYGLQWNIAIPLQGTKNYFTGTNGSSQPYVALLPDLWLSKQIGKKQEILLTLHLSNLYAAGEKQLTAAKGALSIIDTTTVIKSISLIKSSGFTAGLQYNFNFSKHWGIGTGINYNLLNRALIKEKTTGFYTGTVLSEFTMVAAKNGSNWLYLNSSFFTGKIELSYYLGKIKIGSALFVPLSNISSVPGNNIKPVNGQLFLRWRLKK